MATWLCIAFKIVSLQENLQQTPMWQKDLNSCVLLSKLYLCRRIYSKVRAKVPTLIVVYCFQNCIFVGEFTANYLNIQGHLSCVLLSKLYLCRRIYSTLCVKGRLITCYGAVQDKKIWRKFFENPAISAGFSIYEIF